MKASKLELDSLVDFVAKIATLSALEIQSELYKLLQEENQNIIRAANDEDREEFMLRIQILNALSIRLWGTI